MLDGHYAVNDHIRSHYHLLVYVWNALEGGWYCYTNPLLSSSHSYMCGGKLLALTVEPSKQEASVNSARSRALLNELDFFAYMSIACTSIPMRISIFARCTPVCDEHTAHIQQIRHKTHTPLLLLSTCKQQRQYALTVTVLECSSTSAPYGLCQARPRRC